jgi:aminoglycoside phosphotransferase (APT) family kinase protein
MPAADLDVDVALLRRLLAAQHRDLAHLPIEPLAFGWDNVTFRVGSTLVARLPRREMAAPLVEHEQRWLPHLAARLPLPVPRPVRIGVPSEEYPWRWTLCHYLRGETAALSDVRDDDEVARQLGQFVRSMHQAATPAAPVNPFRGVPLADRSEATGKRLAELDGLIDSRRLGELWRRALDASPWSGPPVWLHGDLHPCNVLIDRGRVSGVIDFGDITAGDPATDLAAGWMVFGERARRHFRAAAGRVDDATWTRARGWAMSLGVAFLASSADDPPGEAVARTTLEAVLEP